MNKDQVKGAIKDAAGSIQKGVGDATGSAAQKVKGLAKQAEGKVQKAYGDAKQGASEAVDEAAKAVDRSAARSEELSKANKQR